MIMALGPGRGKIALVCNERVLSKISDLIERTDDSGGLTPGKSLPIGLHYLS